MMQRKSRKNRNKDESKFRSTDDNKYSRKREGKSSMLLCTISFGILAFLFLCSLYFQEVGETTSFTTKSKMNSLRKVEEVKKKVQRVFTSGSEMVKQPKTVKEFYHAGPKSLELIQETLNGNPTIEGIVAVLQMFLNTMHQTQKDLSQQKTTPRVIADTVFGLIQKHLSPFDAVYRGKNIFDVKDDGSIFMSIAAYREHLLDQTLRYAFDNAENPDKLFIGAVVQNCFGLGGGEKPCRTGVQVVGQNKQGRPMTKVSNAPPDVNGIETFCAESKYKKYCENNQIRVLYVDEGEALGPAMARYLASKLWGGETYFMQVDSHLEFAENWDKDYINEVKATKNYPKSILSSYPPGFSHKIGTTPGTKLCACTFSRSEVEHSILRINTGASYHGNEDHPSQIAFIAAGFFFARAEFLKDIPFDPYLPWCFMGEEITLSMRAWTAGWNIYAPRLNLIAHQYRPGRMGLPKYWESVSRTWNHPGMNNIITNRVIKRIKHIVLYPEATSDKIEAENDQIMLNDVTHYGLGTERTGEEYLELTGIDMKNKKCSNMQWCNKGTMA